MIRILLLIALFTLSGCAAIDRINNLDSSAEIADILNKHSEKILTPADVNYIVPRGIKPGYKYFLRYDYFTPEGITSTEYSRMQLAEIDGNALIFDLLNPDLTIQKPKYLKIINGQKFVMSTTKPNQYIRFGGSASVCKFKLGRCEYSPSYSDKVDYVEREFENGVWTTSAPYLGLGRRTETEIYDQNGLILLRVNQKNGAGTKITRFD